MMLKKNIIFFLSLISFSALQAKIYYPENYVQDNSKEIEFAWDVHNVLAQKEYGKTRKLAMAAYTAPGALTKALAQVAWAKITGYQNDASRAQNDINNLPKSADLSGEAYLEIFNKHNLTGLAKIVSVVSNAYRPNSQMFEIVRSLDAKGITQRFASNIGPKLLENLKSKFKYTYKGITDLELIKDGKIVDYSVYGPARREPASHLATVGKPNLQFFIEFNTTHNPNNTKQFIFIDDALANVEQATKAGWIAIHYDYKNPQAMDLIKEDLKALGILDK